MAVPEFLLYKTLFWRCSTSRILAAVNMPSATRKEVNVASPGSTSIPNTDYIESSMISDTMYRVPGEMRSSTPTYRYCAKRKTGNAQICQCLEIVVLGERHATCEKP